LKIEAVQLEGSHVRLEPLAGEHVAGLARAAHFDEVWRYMPFRIDDESSAAGWISVAQAWLDRGEGLCFATVARESDEVVGSTGFLGASPQNRRVEIGATWIAPARQRSRINTEAKYLQMRHAFETWGCLRVEFKTDALNEKSRAALARIGAKEEGILRSHMVMPDGRLRDSVYFSVVESEWPAVKRHLEELLA
jgi:RimJ/RimL family protein N-acetyltransferase